MPLVILYARERLCWALRVLLARDVWQRITELHVCASMQCQIICYATHHWCWGCLQRWKLDTTIRPHFDHTLISESKCWPKWISLILCATLFRTYTGNPQQCGLAGACLSTRERERDFFPILPCSWLGSYCWSKLVLFDVTAILVEVEVGVRVCTKSKEKVIH